MCTVIYMVFTCTPQRCGWNFTTGQPHSSPSESFRRNISERTDGKCCNSLSFISSIYGPQLMIVGLTVFSTLTWCESNTHSVETVLRIWHMIFSWVSEMQDVTSRDAGQRQWATTPSQPHGDHSKPSMPTIHCVASGFRDIVFWACLLRSCRLSYDTQ